MNQLSSGGASLQRRLDTLDHAIRSLADTGDFGKQVKLPRTFEALRRVLVLPGGCAAVRARAAELENAGLFLGTDWASPQILIPSLSTGSLRSPNADTVVLETVSNLRLLAVAKGDYPHPLITPDQADSHLSQVLAINLSLLFSPPTEAERAQQGRMAQVTRELLHHLVAEVGYEKVLEHLVDEIWRILRQRPIQVDTVKRMITQIAVARANPDIDLGAGALGADRLISSLYGTTDACREDPGVEIYRERLATMDDNALQYEASGFARSMHDTGLVSPYHAVLLRHLLGKGDYLLAEAMGLSSTGRDCLLCYHELVHTLIDEAVQVETAQCVYGLALLLERGILYQPPVAPALWRQIGLQLSPTSRQRLSRVFGPTPDARVWLLAGVLSMLGLPLGVGQGDNPTCQSARALSMWAYNDPDYLLHAVTWAARDDEIVMHFEGTPISSRDDSADAAVGPPIDLDPVSVLVVPHLDRIYAEMGRHCLGRDGDPHRWINPEFHGWWSGRGFRINVDVATGNLTELDDFLRHFYASYHPFYNGNQPLIHPQPAGIAVTDSAARFVGWHAISVLRVNLDPQEQMRVYFFNPNNDSGQDWGDGVIVGTAGHGERFGEASLPFEQFASRLYIFHFDPLEPGESAAVDSAELDRVIGYVHRSWGADRI
ncbi:hypothetical protein [Nocardia cyriacigeorgica]|uniref:Uncharacterized protein n=1 Tax=Nocardia cyriacigeorgica TaxID=135487 RepID=A0A4U8VYZ6_9NOCA|nr:hypothetical protein [Nocardia cyriacigeorgica]MBF6100438.1 hypothetical protein [Nocardia cyriacigeorgica]MBF6162037.1 hypothetical protein [Nocardia cyriacigeorgica]MBF6200901.1 hypothetical protein [Nocardia cyriacigeorgica]VFA97224.1 Uncharacterised protein [Nocardia cyriacigeorgica]